MQLATFVVITRNRKDKLQRCLESISEKAPNATVCLIDNGSQDGTEKISGNMSTIVKHLEKNIGVAKARNLGLSIAEKEFGSQYFVFLDDDAYLKHFSLDAIEDTYRANPDCGIIAPLVLYPDGSVQESIRSYPTLKALIWRGFGLYKIYKPQFYKTYTSPPRLTYGRIDWAIGACLVIKKEVFQKTGVFDEHYFFGYEDADMCRRAQKKGFRTLYDPTLVVTHEYARTSSKLLSVSTLHHIKSIFRFLARN